MPHLVPTCLKIAHYQVYRLLLNCTVCRVSIPTLASTHGNQAYTPLQRTISQVTYCIMLWCGRDGLLLSPAVSRRDTRRDYCEARHKRQIEASHEQNFNTFFVTPARIETQTRSNLTLRSSVLHQSMRHMLCHVAIGAAQLSNSGCAHCCAAWSPSLGGKNINILTKNKK